MVLKQILININTSIIILGLSNILNLSSIVFILYKNIINMFKLIQLLWIFIKMLILLFLRIILLESK